MKTDCPLKRKQIISLPSIVARLLEPLLLFLSIFQFGFSSIILNSCENFIYTSIPDLDSIKHTILRLEPKLKSKIENESKQRFFKPNIHFWTIFKNDSISHYALLDNVIGKSMPISFLVIFNNNGKIIDSEIIKYREPYGGEISGKNWLNQFKLKSSKSNFSIGKEIDGISGATISVYSVSKGIKKLALLIPSIIEKNNR